MSRPQRVIVSCTSTHDRLECLYYVVESILRQSYKPDAFYINISKTHYLRDKGIKESPAWFNNDAIKVNFVENTGSYRKLLPVLDNACDNDLIVTIDDDVIYHRNWLIALVDAASAYPSMIVCGRARRIKKNVFGRWQSYHNWSVVKGESSGFWLLPIGCAGIAYRKKLMCEEFIKDRKFLEIAKANDDLWFRAASQIMQTNVYVNSELENGNMHIVHNRGLEKTNLFSLSQRSLFFKYGFKIFGWFFGYLGMLHSNNDVAWKKLINYSSCYAGAYSTREGQSLKKELLLSKSHQPIDIDRLHDSH